MLHKIIVESKELRRYGLEKYPVTRSVLQLRALQICPRIEYLPLRTHLDHASFVLHSAPIAASLEDEYERLARSAKNAREAIDRKVRRPLCDVN